MRKMEQQMGEICFLTGVYLFYSLCTTFRYRVQNLLILVRILEVKKKKKRNDNWTHLLFVRDILSHYDPALLIEVGVP